MKKFTLFFNILLLLSPFPIAAQWKGKPVDFSHDRLQISDNKRFLQHTDSTPFFYLGDTGWELFYMFFSGERAWKG